MKTLLSLEEVAQLALAIFLINLQPIVLPWWAWAGLFLAPDVGMLGYLAGPRIGAWCYNLFHHKTVAAAFIGAGLILPSPVWLVAGLLLWAHSSFDRVMGYGLKKESGFTDTHLGSLRPSPAPNAGLRKFWRA